MIGIYKITNLINGKVYIGQSVNIKKRFIAHKSTAFNPKNEYYNYPLYRAIRKYGIENFSFEVIEECNKESLNDREIFYISKYQSHGENGYNLDDGGNQASHYIKLSDELVSEIIYRLKTSLDNSDIIGDDFGVTGRTVRAINSGECCYRDVENYPIRQHLYELTSEKPKINYCKICGKEIDKKATYCVECSHKAQRRVEVRPESLELARLVKENGFEKVGKMFNVSDNAIKAWCKDYGIPHKKQELISWYNKQMGIEDPIIPQKEKTDQRKKVAQIDLVTNEIIATHESTNAAARSLGKKKGTHITEVCQGKLKQIYGYGWKYL